MNYIKHTWVSGDLITSERLNHLEDGVESADRLPEASTDNNGNLVAVSSDGNFKLVDAHYGYQDPTRSLGEMPVETMTRIPAIVELSDSTEYTFTFIDSAHPDGITITEDAYFDTWNDVDGIAWLGEQDDDSGVYQYLIFYIPDTQENIFDAAKYVEDTDSWEIYRPVSVYQLGEIHKCPLKYVEFPDPNEAAVGSILKVSDAEPGQHKYVIGSTQIFRTIDWNDGSPYIASTTQIGLGDIITRLKVSINSNSYKYLYPVAQTTINVITANPANPLTYIDPIYDDNGVSGMDVYIVKRKSGVVPTQFLGSKFTVTFS